MKQNDNLGGMTYVPLDNLIDLCFQEGVVGVKFAEAQNLVPALRRKVQALPREFKAWANLGVALIFVGDLPAARASLEKALEGKSDFYPAWYVLHVVAEKEGDTATMRRAGQKLKECLWGCIRIIDSSKDEYLDKIKGIENQLKDRLKSGGPIPPSIIAERTLGPGRGFIEYSNVFLKAAKDRLNEIGAGRTDAEIMLAIKQCQDAYATMASMMEHVDKMLAERAAAVQEDTDDIEGIPPISEAEETRPPGGNGDMQDPVISLELLRYSEFCHLLVLNHVQLVLPPMQSTLLQKNIEHLVILGLIVVDDTTGVMGQITEKGKELLGRYGFQRCPQCCQFTFFPGGSHLPMAACVACGWTFRKGDTIPGGRPYSVGFLPQELLLFPGDDVFLGGPPRRFESAPGDSGRTVPPPAGQISHPRVPRIPTPPPPKSEPVYTRSIPVYIPPGLVKPSPTAHKERVVPDDTIIQTCTFCQGLVKDGTCGFCGAKRCLHCGEMNWAVRTTCEGCGKDLPASK